MDKRNSKKTDQTKPEKRDRGDNLKKVERVFKKLLDRAEEVKSLNPGGDSERKVVKEDKPRVIVFKKSDEAKLKILEHGLSKENLVKKNDKGEEAVKNLAKRNEISNETVKCLVKRNEKSDEIVKNVTKKNEKSDETKNFVKRIDRSPATDKVKIKEKSDETIKSLARKNEKTNETVRTSLDDRKKARDKNNSNLRPKNSPVVKKEELTKLNVKLPIVPVEVKNDRPPKTPDLLPEFSPSIEYSPLEHPIADRKRVSQRKPVIKTVTANTKVFKAVTFVDQKSTPTSLQIKIPTEVKSTNRSVETNTKKLNPTVSRVSVKEKQVSSRRVSQAKKLEKRKKHTNSPVVSAKVRSPPTEVAKWAPASINRHTKPYYEAWVNTTLAAISKNARMDKLFLEKQNLLQSFQRALAERPETPELVYENFNDERYTGRIKVNSKHR